MSTRVRQVNGGRYAVVKLACIAFPPSLRAPAHAADPGGIDPAELDEMVDAREDVPGGADAEVAHVELPDFTRDYAVTLRARANRCRPHTIRHRAPAPSSVMLAGSG